MDTSVLLGNDMSTVVEADRAHVWHHLIQHKPFETIDPRVIVEGKGMKVWDAKGKEHLDAVSGGVWTVNVGYGRESIADAVRDQLVRMCYFAGSAGSIPGSMFAKRLIEKMPGLSRVYYANSGSEANEKVFKMVRQISHRHHGGRKYKILFRERDYHGTTITALSAGGQPQRAMHTARYTPGFVEVPHCLEYRKQWDVANYGERAADAIEEVILREGPDTIGAICLEPVTAGGGVIVPPAGYWERVQEICAKYQILIHIDEVVCGVGRTGEWFGYQHYGVKPDFVTMAKGVASGYAAIACTVTTEAVFEMFKDDAERPDELFPRHLDLRRLRLGAGGGAGEHADHRGRGAAGQHDPDGRAADRATCEALAEQASGDRRRCAARGCSAGRNWWPTGPRRNRRTRRRWRPWWPTAWRRGSSSG